MRKLIAMCAVVTLLCGAAYATDYTFVGASGDDWTNPASWDQNSSYPQTASDRAFITNGNQVDLQEGIWGAPPVALTLGELTVTNGSSFFAWGRDYTFNMVSSGGKSGNVWWNGGGGVAAYASSGFVMNVDGDFYWTGSTFSDYATVKQITMNSDGKAMYRGWSSTADANIIINGVGVWDNNSNTPYWCANTVTVKSGKSIGSNPGVDGRWTARTFVFEDGQSNLPAPGARVDFYFGAGGTDNGTPQMAVNGLIYPRDVYVAGATYDGGVAITPFVYKMKGGDLTVTRDLLMTSNNFGGTHVFDTTDNDTGVSRNVLVKNNLRLGQDWMNMTRKLMMKFNASNVKVGGNIIVGGQGYVGNGEGGSYNACALDLGSSTVNVGGNFIVMFPSSFTLANWNAGTSTIICDGNGTGATQILHTWGDCGIALNNLTINNPGGTVRLENVGGTLTWAEIWAPPGYPLTTPGNMLLRGNLVVECGTFDQNGQLITFNGPAHLLKDVVGGGFDCISLLAGAVVNLGSNITMDNILMGSGSKLYLNGFNLMADGQTYLGSQVGQWPNDGGIIYGAEIPEPATLLLLGTGALGVLGYIRRRRTQ